MDTLPIVERQPTAFSSYPEMWIYCGRRMLRLSTIWSA
jgi:hypothetical protein